MWKILQMVLAAFAFMANGGHAYADPPDQPKQEEVSAFTRAGARYFAVRSGELPTRLMRASDSWNLQVPHFEFPAKPSVPLPKLSFRFGVGIVRLSEESIAAFSDQSKLVEWTLYNQASLKLLRKLPKIEHLCVSRVELTEELVAEIAALNLSELSIMHSKVQTLRPLSKMKRLTTLTVSFSEVLDFRGIEEIKGLRRVSVFNSDFNDSDAKQLAPLQELTEVDLACSRISSEAIPLLAKSAKLKRIWLSPLSYRHASFPGARVDDGMLLAAKKAGILHKLSVFYGPAGKIPGSDKEVKSAWLGYTQVGDGGVKALLDFGNLESLEVDGLDLSVRGFESISKFGSLRHLRANVDGFDKERARALANSKSIKSLDIDGIMVSDAEVAELVKLPQLADLSMSVDTFSSKGFQSLQSCPTLRVVRISDGSFNRSAITEPDVAAFKRVRPDVKLTVSH